MLIAISDLYLWPTHLSDSHLTIYFLSTLNPVIYKQIYSRRYFHLPQLLNPITTTH